jgi:hypothetical protein
MSFAQIMQKYDMHDKLRNYNHKYSYANNLIAILHV